MKLLTQTASLLSILFLAGCQSNGIVDCCIDTPRALRIVNAYATPVDVSLDGSVIAQGMGAGTLSTFTADAGAHTLVLKPSGSVAGSSQSITIAPGALTTVAVVRASDGAVSSTVLDDTGSVVPSGATKLRVLHLAPNAGVLQVYRTQPDYDTPISWQFPFTYQPEPTSLSAPFLQSTVGTWEVRIWQTPADATGWASAPIKLVIPLASGEKHTILLLDQPGGGVVAQVI